MEDTFPKKHSGTKIDEKPSKLLDYLKTYSGPKNTPPPQATTCPSCGYCSHCGRLNRPLNYPYQYDPYQYKVWCQSPGTGDSRI